VHYITSMVLARTAVPVCLFLLCLVITALSASSIAHKNSEDQQLLSSTSAAATPPLHRGRLRDGQAFPLVGFGVGNLPHELIPDKVAEAWQLGYRLFDTAHASRNAHLIRQGLQKAAQQQQRHHLRMNNAPNEAAAAERTDTAADADVVHIVTKIWYTHLGYERTQLALAEIRQDYKDIFAGAATTTTTTTTAATAVHLHVLIHWPRCRDDEIPWMNCQQEEDNLPIQVKEAGPPPHQHKDTAFLGSWKALEEAYHRDHDDSNNNNNNNNNNDHGEDNSSSNSVIVSSIGVSNFDLSDLQALEEMATVMPHVSQYNVWNVVFNPLVLDYCRRNLIQYQVYNVMNGIVGNKSRAPRAWQAVGASAVRILHWLTQKEGIAVIPRTAHHLAENAPSNVVLRQQLPDDDVIEREQMVRAVKALLQGRDDDDDDGGGGGDFVDPAPARPQAVFVNKHDNPAHIFWHNPVQGEEVPVRLDLPPGETYVENTHAGHTFVVYESSDKGGRRQEYQVQQSSGRETFHIEL